MASTVCMHTFIMSSFCYVERNGKVSGVTQDALVCVVNYTASRFSKFEVILAYAYMMFT